MHNFPIKALLFWSHLLAGLCTALILKDDFFNIFNHAMVNSVFQGDAAIWSFYLRAVIAFSITYFILSLPATWAYHHIKKGRD